MNIRTAIIFGVPLLLGILELGHPAIKPGDPIAPIVAPMAVWWTALHVLQIPLFPLLGVALLLLVAGLQGRAARISRAAIYGFIVLYPAFDAAVGISSGVLLQHVNSASGLTVLEPALQALFWGPVTGSIALLASACWLVGVVAAALARRSIGAPVSAVVFLVLSGVLLGIAHIRPFGPLGCLCFLIAAIVLERSRVQLPRSAPA